MPPAIRVHLRALRWALAGYTVFVALILGWRTPTTPVVDTLEIVAETVRAVGADGWLTDPRIEFLANVVLFVPFGLLLAAVVARPRWWWAVVGGFGYSLTAEVAQAIWRAQRSGTVSDVIANTAGSLIGAGIAVLIARRLSGRRSGRPAGQRSDRRSGPDEQLDAAHLALGEPARDADLGERRVEQVGPTRR